MKHIIKIALNLLNFKHTITTDADINNNKVKDCVGQMLKTDNKQLDINNNSAAYIFLCGGADINLYREIKI